MFKYFSNCDYAMVAQFFGRGICRKSEIFHAEQQKRRFWVHAAWKEDLRRRVFTHLPHLLDDDTFHQYSRKSMSAFNMLKLKFMKICLSKTHILEEKSLLDTVWQFF
ncbi:hypothetical protein JTB14_025345 [Gonioctena quinquepunctata]|nr:hypothetical protein JTB14_025345 [Gonioctena quinquepunctata]